MSIYPNSLDNLISKFASLPGVGIKSAQRMAFYILSLTDNEVNDFAAALSEAHGSIHKCPVCSNITDSDICDICADSFRDSSVICVVSDPKDVIAIERGREYNGLYHVLHGVISPINHVSPDDLSIKELVERVASSDNISEVILATNPDTEGETTARYIAKLLQPFQVTTSRLAYGIPVGSSLEFADDATLMRAIEGRQIMY